jgi:hypothetical protein
VPLEDKNRTIISMKSKRGGEEGRGDGRTEDDNSDIDRAEDAELIRLFEEAVFTLGNKDRERIRRKGFHVSNPSTQK